MSEWISVKKQLPPVGEKVLMNRPEGGFSVMTLSYNLVHEEDLFYTMKVRSEELLKSAGGFWMAIPPLPKIA